MPRIRSRSLGRERISVPPVVLLSSKLLKEIISILLYALLIHRRQDGRDGIGLSQSIKLLVPIRTHQSHDNRESGLGLLLNEFLSIFGLKEPSVHMILDSKISLVQVEESSYAGTGR